MDAGGPQTVRAFFALEIPADRREVLGRFIDRASAAEPRLKWVPAGNLHLTLRFLGHVQPSVFDQVCSKLGGLPIAPFTLGLGGVDLFGRGGRARVVWLAVTTGGPEAMALAAAIEAACVGAGLEPEARAFQPHLTIARAPAGARTGLKVGPLPPPPVVEPWTVREVTLFRSTLGRSGAVYEAVARLPLSPPPAAVGDATGEGR